MGLFDWLKAPESNVEEADDLIWLIDAAKMNGIIVSVRAAVTAPDAPAVILVVAHFEDCLAELRQLLEKSGIDDPRVFAVRADELPSVEDSLQRLDESQLVEMIVAERHPLLERDEALIEFARQCRCRFRVVHHLSLEDALMKVFAGEWVQNLLKKLGASEYEPIHSHMVARRIRDAQKKISRRAKGDAAASSAEEWMEKNT